MPSQIPLSTLLSQTLVAFTIELDNELEHQMPHRTANHGSTPGARQAPWLTSLAMWSTCLRFVGEEGVTVAELERLARTPTNLNGMERWGYIVVEPDPAGGRAKIARLTPRGREAQAAYRHRLAMRSKRAGRSASAGMPSEPFGSRWRDWPASPARGSRPYSEDWSPIQTAGGRRSAGPTRCRITLWCCIAAGIRMGVEVDGEGLRAGCLPCWDLAS